MPRTRKRPNCYIVAGSNGAGKTTFAMRFLPRYADCPNFINPDLVAQSFSPFDPDAVMTRAGRVVLERIHESKANGVDFSFETTLSGRSYAGLIKELRQAGYRVHMFYLWVPSVDLALARIRDRVTKGGHNIPSKAVRRRFKRTVRNLFTLYRPLLDTLHFFDNSRAEPRLIFKDEAGKTTVFDVEVYKELLSVASR